MSMTITGALRRDLLAARLLDRDLAVAFSQARGHVRTPARTRELANAFDLARGRAYHLARDLDRTHVVALSRARNVQLAGIPTGEYAGELVFVEIGHRPRDLAYELAADFAYRCRHVRELVLDDDLGAPRAQSAYLLVLIQDTVRAVAEAFDGVLDQNPLAPAQAEQVRRAVRLIAAGARVLPPDERSRYQEEFNGEIYELAEAGASRQQLILYVSRQLNRMFELRAELRRDVRKD